MVPAGWGSGPARIRLVAVGVAALAATTMLPASAVRAAPAAPAPPALSHSVEVYSGDFPDPDIISVGSLYWAYGTGSGFRNLQVVNSTDLLAGTPPTDALPVLPSWALPGRTWSPGVVQIGSGFVMYYTVHDAASGDQCLSVATSPTPRGPFVDRSSSPFVCQLLDGGSIDPAPFAAPDGRLYLLWKSDNNSTNGSPVIWSAPLAPDGLRLTAPPTILLSDTAAWESPVIEGPAMLTLDGRYFVFFGANLWYTSGSGIGYAECTSPLGPCQDMSPAGPWLGTTGSLVGPAGPAPFRTLDGATLLGFNAWTGAVGYGPGGGARTLRVTPLTFTSGYRATSRDGGVFTFGVATYLGSASTAHPVAAIVGLDETADGRGYWQVGADGGVFAFGTAGFYGSTGAIRLAAPIVAMMASPSDRGYALVARDGGVFTFGDFAFAGSGARAQRAAPVVGGATSPLLDGPGYWLARADGTVDSFGAAPGFAPSAAARTPVVAIAADPSGIGYWTVSSDGRVAASGSAHLFGSLGPAAHAPIVAIVPTPTGAGYWLVGADGGVYTFGDAGFAGSLGGVHLVAGITAASGAPATLACPC